MFDNPLWCRNPQFYLQIKDHTHLKIVLKKKGRTKGKATIGMVLCRASQTSSKKITITQKKNQSQLGNQQLLAKGPVQDLT